MKCIAIIVYTGLRNGGNLYVDKWCPRIAERINMIPYLDLLTRIADFCEKFKKDTIEFAFTDSRTKNLLERASRYEYCWTPRYQGYWTRLCGVVNFCDILGIESLETTKSELVERVAFLNNPDSIQQRSFFEIHIDFIKNCFELVQDQIRNKLQLLDEEELKRLDEALNCYMQGCNYSAITMSVSAIEFRLISLMLSKCPNPELEELTLGQLIREYLDNKQKYGSVIPRKHEPLLNHCNVYRVFSVHPKREKITKSIATSIINMTFAFLLDEELKHKAEMK